MKTIRQTGHILRFDEEETQEEQELKYHLDILHDVVESNAPLDALVVKAVQSLCYLVLKGYADNFDTEDSQGVFMD